MRSGRGLVLAHGGVRCLAVLLVMCGVPVSSAGAATIAVNTQTDVSNNADGQCSLREATGASAFDMPSGNVSGECAAGTSGQDTVTVPAGLYTLSSPLLMYGPVTIAGAGATQTILSQGGAGRVITVGFDGTHTVDVTFDGVTVTGGHATDGGAGGDSFGSNGAPGGFPGGSGSAGGGGSGDYGGGIYNDSPGTLILLNSRVTGNSSGDGGPGGLGVGGAGGDGVGAGSCGSPGAGTGGPGGTGGDGGGVFSYGPVVVRDSVISSNTAGAGGAGGGGGGGFGGSAGAQFQQGCAGGTGTGGNGGRGGRGGAIAAVAPITVERSVITGNHTGAGGAGGDGDGGVGGVGGASGGTGGAGGSGGGGAGGAGGDGGAIDVQSGAAVAVTASTISSNQTGNGAVGGTGSGGYGGNGGGTTGIGWFGGDGTGGAGGRGGDGGGIHSGAGGLSLGSSLLFDNRAGAGGYGGAGQGGAGGNGGSSNGHGGDGGTGSGATGGGGGRGGAVLTSGQSQVTNVTIAQNQGGAGGHGGHGGGGGGGNAPGSNAGWGGQGNGAGGGAAGGAGVHAGTSTLQLLHATLDANVAGSVGPAGTGQGGNPGTGAVAGQAGQGTNGSDGAAAAGAVENGGATVALTDSVVSANTPFNCNGAVDDGGYDTRFGDETCPGTTADPKLAPLGDNGGPTRTMALGAGSAARDAVPAAGAGCASTDQRGVSRPRFGACDAGAYEQSPPDVTTGTASAVSTDAATLAGTVAPNAGAATYRFEYGATIDYGSATAAQDTGAGVSPIAVSAALSGLAPATTYHYRIVATTADGSATGEDQTFTTSSPAAGPGGAAAGGDLTAPRFLSASMSPKKFAVNARAPAEQPVSAAAHGTTFRFVLSEAARVLLRIERVAPGRRIGKRCVKANARNRSRRACKRYVAAGSFAVQAVSGANKKQFSGRIGRKRLSPGSYRATLIARDAAGNTSAPRRLTFRVVPR